VGDLQDIKKEFIACQACWLVYNRWCSVSDKDYYGHFEQRHLQIDYR
jgi:hypothetical protein